MMKGRLIKDMSSERVHLDQADLMHQSFVIGIIHEGSRKEM